MDTRDTLSIVHASVCCFRRCCGLPLHGTHQHILLQRRHVSQLQRQHGGGLSPEGLVGDSQQRKVDSVANGNNCVCFWVLASKG